MAFCSIYTIWEELDLCESYLVQCEFEEAASLSSSIIIRIRTIQFVETVDDIQLADMMESAALVFVQSMKELKRTHDLFVELKLFFGSVAAIPVQVFLTGASMQIMEKTSSDLKATFEEFLGNWKYVGDVYVLKEVEPQKSTEKESIKQSIMSAENYIDVAEVYTITFLGMFLHNPDLAISWTEKAALPEESRQNILRRLQSLSRVTQSSLSPGSGAIQKREQNDTGGNGVNPSESHSKLGKSQNEDQLKANTIKPIHPRIQRITNQLEPCFLWFRTVHLRFGSTRVVLPGGKLMLLGSLMVLIYYILLKKSTVLKRLVAGQASSIRRAIVDAWQLAFSFNVNPLAAVQQLPSAPHGRT